MLGNSVEDQFTLHRGVFDRDYMAYIGDFLQVYLIQPETEFPSSFKKADVLIQLFGSILNGPAA